MKRILVVDDMPIFREPIAASIRREGFKAFTASNGKEALDLISQEKPDLILLDIAMPVMNGLECLKVLRANPETKSIPVLMLTAMAEREPVAEAVKLGVQGYLLKSQFSLKDMITKINGMLCKTKDQSAQKSPPSHPPAAEQKTTPTPQSVPKKITLPEMSRSKTLAHIRKKLELQAVPPVLHSVIAMVNNSRSSIEEIAALVRQDPALAIRVLKIANSSMFGSGRQVQSLAEATQRIGLSGIRNTVAAILAIEHFSTATIGGVHPQRFWEHSLATATLAQLIGQSKGIQDTENLFLAGLLHDIGRLTLCNALPNEYEAVLRYAAKQNCDVSMVEKKAFGIGHADITREVLIKLEAPDSVQETARLHELQPAQIERASHDTKDATIVAMANRLVHALVLGDSGHSRLLPYHEFASALDMSGEVICTIANKAADRAQEMAMFYASKSESELRESLAQELAGKAEQSFKLVVFASDSPGDPLTLFFEQLGWLDRAEPEMAVIYVSKAVRPVRHFKDLKKLEKELGYKLGVLFASPKDGSTPTADLLEDRPWQTVSVPGWYENLIDAVVKLHKKITPQTVAAGP